MPINYILLALIAVSIRAANYPLTKIVISELPPLLAVSIRLTIMTIICLPFVKIPFGHFRSLFLLSFTLLALPLGLTTVSLTEVDSSLAALFVILSIPTSQLLSYFLLKETLTKKQLLGLMLSLIGCCLVIISPEVNADNADATFLLFIGSLSYAYATIRVKKVQATPVQIAVYSYLFSIPQILILSLLFEVNHLDSLIKARPAAYWITLIIGTSSVIHFTLWSDLLKRFAVATVTPFTFLLPIISLIVAYLLLGETTHWLAILGGLTTIIGIAFQIIKKPKNT